MDLARFPRRRYTHAPTPIELLPHFTKALAASCPGGVGPEIWIKRDDLLGLFPGGNKTRKLEFLAADALAQGADTLITCGAPQSNHCRITLSAAVKEGLKCRFVIEERVPGQLQEGGQRQQLHVRADGRRGDHRGARRLGHGRRDVEGGAGSRLARPQGLHHPGRRLERDRRPGLRRLRAGDAAAVVGHGPGARCRRGRLGQLGHPWRHGGGLLRQQHQDPADRHRRQPRSGRPGAAGATRRRRPSPTCWASARCRARR